jgi:hypothetical protein
MAPYFSQSEGQLQGSQAALLKIKSFFKVAEKFSERILHDHFGGLNVPHA